MTCSGKRSSTCDTTNRTVSKRTTGFTVNRCIWEAAIWAPAFTALLDVNYQNRGFVRFQWNCRFKNLSFFYYVWCSLIIFIIFIILLFIIFVCWVCCFFLNISVFDLLFSAVTTYCCSLCYGVRIVCYFKLPLQIFGKVFFLYCLSTWGLCLPCQKRPFVSDTTRFKEVVTLILCRFQET